MLFNSQLIDEVSVSVKNLSDKIGGFVVTVSRLKFAYGIGGVAFLLLNKNFEVDDVIFPEEYGQDALRLRLGDDVVDARNGEFNPLVEEG